MRPLRAHLTYANVMATVAVFIALGGGAYAAVQISGDQLQDRSVRGRKIKPNALGGQEIAERKLGTVPAATTAQTATTATNATQLDGKPASDYRLACPTGLQRAGDVCFGPTRLPPNTWEGALKVCMGRQQRLPNPGELALIYDHTGATQNAAWSDDAYANAAGARAFALGQTINRTLFSGDFARTMNLDYYCVISPTNSP